MLESGNTNTHTNKGYKEKIIEQSPVNRIGGKYYLRNWLLQFIPKHNIYIEPFCGGASLLFAKKPSKVEVLNDIDNHLIGFFRVIKDSNTRQKLIKELAYMPYSRQWWQELRERWKAGNIPKDIVQRVTEWYFLNRSCFSGDQLRGGFAVPSITGRNPARTYSNRISKIISVAGRLKGVTIECLPFEECIKQYDSSNTFFYCDPPYLQVPLRQYYGNKFTIADHQRLAGLLKGIKGRVIVSHYENALYGEFYQGWDKHIYESFKVSRGITKKNRTLKRPKTTEAIYCNF
ncbi:MAG: DNA adenine methylase [Candidatus Brocadiaceae bacterium]|nr:DNA adenine methylase [Candidatus Brocadiaceae bacterium]